MRLLIMVFYVGLGLILWRIVRVGLRMFQGSREEKSGRVYTSPSEPPIRSHDFESGEIQDAKFEDITPPKNPEKGKQDSDA